MDVPQPTLPSGSKQWWPAILLTFALSFGLMFGNAYARREEISRNWSKYRSDPFYILVAPFFKPDDDPRSASQFAADTFSDAISEILGRVFTAFTEPILQIFRVFTGALDESVGSLFIMRGMLQKMYASFNGMVDIFVRRYAGVLHQLRMTFLRLYDAFQKTFGAAASAVYAGLSTIYSMLSFMDLLMKIVITILVVLVVMVVLLFFVLWPFIPLILSVIGIIGATAMGGAVGGMSDAFGCFAGDTRIVCANGALVAAKDVRIGTQLGYGAGTVQGVLLFEQEDEDTYCLHGVEVSGSHIVYSVDGAPLHVKDCPDARRLPFARRNVYCFLTSSRRIPVQSDIGVLEFADWEELDGDDSVALRAWHRHVYTTLNGAGAAVPVPTQAALASEAVVSGHARVYLDATTTADIASVRPGMRVLDASGALTRVVGIVRTARTEVQAASAIASGVYVSAGAWLRHAGDADWSQPLHTSAPPHEGEDVWYALFTESGSYCLDSADGRIGIRDFSDVGISALPDTYPFVLGALGAL